MGAGSNGNGWHDSRLDLSTKVAVVTGGAGGIGRATAIQLALEGAKAVGVVDFSESVEAFVRDANQRLKREVMVAFRGDVTDSAFRKSTFRTLEQKFGPVSFCIPAAGITRDKLAVKVNKETGDAEIYSEGDFHRVVEVDLTAPIYWAMETIASVARDRSKRGLKRWEPSEGVQGAVIFIGSVSSTGNRGQISYATCKAGLMGAQATLAAEAVFYGVRSAIIHPGYTDTPMVRTLGEDFIEKAIIPQTQLRRLILPEEIAHAICFMIRNSAVSGELWADAGWHPTA
jgi:NAD(P)-dependent dehydrogenase (short-subunit alcohol dehydrogenase family)